MRPVRCLSCRNKPTEKRERPECREISRPNTLGLCTQPVNVSHWIGDHFRTFGAFPCCRAEFNSSLEALSCLAKGPAAVLTATPGTSPDCASHLSRISR